eukprot:comp20146_c0_seq1/m.24914 comp20146_c0_seq1/g.24914  ORF comp20146_c0_seq1/g.24914 comp20146_c0_seq1/m.24914 type:complete len:150 (-) comp20146_c0_seq1:419-868(-)
MQHSLLFLAAVAATAAANATEISDPLEAVPTATYTYSSTVPKPTGNPVVPSGADSTPTSTTTHTSSAEAQVVVPSTSESGKGSSSVAIGVGVSAGVAVVGAVAGLMAYKHLRAQHEEMVEDAFSQSSTIQVNNSFVPATQTYINPLSNA